MSQPVIMDEATQRQVSAADPRASTWLSANAGSVKTRVLTDRVARLLLAGTSPQNILCLTYTKAAAGEMQNRLFARLGKWAMLPDGDLRQELAKLGEAGATMPLDRARTLFARAIETPGGLRIQTIHAFCAGLLRRFPLEAGVSPGFKEMDERTGALLRMEVADNLALARPDLTDGLVRHFTGAEFDKLLMEINQNREAFAEPPAPLALRAALELGADEEIGPLLASTLPPGCASDTALALPVLRKGLSTDHKLADTLSAINWDKPSHRDLAALEKVLLFGDSAKEPFAAKTGKVPTKKLAEANRDITAWLDGLMQRIEAARPKRLSFASLDRSLALHAYAHSYVAQLEAAKQARGLLDFDDLIRRARALLTDKTVAQWVLYRLDGGIDHILVDEAQDTSPDQWAVIEHLAQEITAGEGAHSDRPRTIFVVGDRKQSIYSFQGADPEGFGRMRAHFGAALAPPGPGLVQLNLEHSFRSSEAVLRSVDLTFSPPHGAGLERDAMHRAFWPDLPGRVDIWPPVPKPDKPEPALWTSPDDPEQPRDQHAILADQVAEDIARMIATETLPDGKGGARAINEGDVLILVRSRSALFSEIIRACKQRGLSIAGKDKIKVGAELAVRDIAAVLRFLALAEDDLSLAAALRSPLFGWSEQDLFSLAQGRAKGAYLWQALRAQAEQHPKTMAILNDLRSQADFLRPYDLIGRLLLHHGGRMRLMARLGPEAEDGIDALLSQALAYETTEIPSLTGFTEWMSADDLEVKRQLDNAGGRIRVMTVHAAKGLEAPIVILPDTAKKKEDLRRQIFAEGGVAHWPPTKAELPPVLA
ncbi:MAG: double-strand break repair helicase AddA, partial [Rhodobacteraceae bacterium]|nr:double-strand break repair helicase AddA [Paracoccaceae bacterium]